MRGQICKVVWRDGTELRCTWKYGRLLPLLCRADGVTLGDTTWIHPRVEIVPLQFLRHEFTHAKQQAEAKKAGVGLVRWVLRYLTHPTLRRAIEAEADKARLVWYENNVRVSDPTITFMEDL